jgi:hypothetical protein
MSSTEKEVFRPVPYRFLINDSNADVCKLERLTNLFPDMKASIELGMLLHLFEITKIILCFIFVPKNCSKSII